MNHETCTMADADRMARDLQRDPAAVGYGAYLRRKGYIGPVLPAETPASEAAAAERKVRRAMADRFRL